MLNLNLELQPETEKRLKQIFEQCEDKEVFAQNIITYQISEIKKAIINIELDLKEFEEKYQLSSEEFYQKFNNGEVGDDEDLMIWLGIYEMLIENKKKLNILE